MTPPWGVPESIVITSPSSITPALSHCRSSFRTRLSEIRSSTYFRTGNAAVKFNQLDRYVGRRLRRFLVKRKGRTLRAGEVDRWTDDFFHEHGLHRLRGTVKYPGAA